MAGQPNGSEQEANSVAPLSPEQATAEAYLDKLSAPAQPAESAASKPRRSNEFWLALAGITATLIVGTAGAVISYMVSVDKIRADEHAETTRYRRAAYVNYLTAESALWTAAFDLSNTFSQLACYPDDETKVEKANQWKVYDHARVEANRVGEAVSLAAGPAVTKILPDWRRYDNNVEELTREVNDLADRNRLQCNHDEQNKVNRLTKETQFDSRPRVSDFVASAHSDVD